MDFNDWIPALTVSGVTTTGLLGAAWLVKNLILTRLQKSVGAEFDEKLERIRSELRSKEGEIVALRSAVMTTMSTRQIALEKRRLEAAEEIWSAVTDLAPAKLVSSVLAVFKLNEVANQQPRIRK